MLRYVGLDVHKRSVEVCIVDPQGRVLQRLSLGGDRAALESFATTHLLPTDHLALEATTHSWAVARLLKPHVARLVVSNPLLTKAIATAKIKTDKVDAHALAQLLRCDYLPLVWQPDEQTEERRTLCSRRASLVSERTRLKNRIHAVLTQALLPIPTGDLFSQQGRDWLAKQELPALERGLIESDLRLLAACEAEQKRLDEQLVKEAHGDNRVRLLMTLPGVDYTVALALLAALGEVERFTDGDHAASYLGLVPSTRQSGSHSYHGPITKHGNSRTRWLMVQAAQQVGRHPGPLGVFFRRLAAKKNRNVAVVATARKLVVIAWQMLKNNEPYRYAQPKATEGKLARLRVKATGTKRTGGTAKGSKRSANYGTGEGSRRVPSLKEVYEKEGLPAAKGATEVTAGEQRAVAAAGVTEYVAGLGEARREARKGKVVQQPETGEGSREETSLDHILTKEKGLGRQTESGEAGSAEKQAAGRRRQRRGTADPVAATAGNEK